MFLKRPEKGNMLLEHKLFDYTVLQYQLIFETVDVKDSDVKDSEFYTKSFFQRYHNFFATENLIKSTPMFK